MAQAGPFLSRRLLCAAAAIAPVLTVTATPNTRASAPIQALRAQRDAVIAEIESVSDDDHYDDEVERLSALHDALGARMIDHPIRSAADARAKLSVLDDLYHHPMHVDGHDRVLFEQVLAWLDNPLG